MNDPRATCSACGKETTAGGSFCPFCGAPLLPGGATQPIAAGIPAGATLAGKFQIQRELGRGAFGVVYEAKDTLLDRTVALKTIRADAFGSVEERDSFERRFLREARAVARLGHPGIIAIHEAGQDRGTSYLAMEYVAGRTLRSILRDRGALPAGEAIAIADAMLKALQAAHEQGIVHRDVKPENVMVRDDGVVKVADFGIAKALHQGATTLTKDGAILGTPSYMAPEQILGKTVDARADVFAAAAVVYEMLAGRKPFEADSLPGLMYRILNETPAPLAAIASVPSALADAIMRGLDKDPARRYQSAAEMAAALHQDSAPTRAVEAPTRIGQASTRIPETPTRVVGPPVSQRAIPIVPIVVIGLALCAMLAMAALLGMLFFPFGGGTPGSEPARVPRAAASPPEAAARPSPEVAPTPSAAIASPALPSATAGPATEADVQKILEQVQRTTEEAQRVVEMLNQGQSIPSISPPSPAPTSDEEAVGALVQAMNDATARLDADLMASYFTDDALLQFKRQTLRGRDQILAFYRSDFGSVAPGTAIESKTKIKSLSFQGDTALARISDRTYVNGKESSSGTYALTLARTRAGYRIRVAIEQ